MPIEKIIVELIFAVVLQSTGSSFWSCAKYLRLRGRLLANYEILKTTVTSEDRNTLEAESGKLRLGGTSYAEAMELALSEGKKAQIRRMAILSLPIAAVIAASPFLGNIFLTINLSFFFLLAVFPLRASVRTAVFGNLLRVSLMIFRWNGENPEACRRFCNDERPVFRAIHKVITEL